MTSREQVAEFLKTFKRRLDEVGWLYVVNRKENRDGLIEIGITKTERKDIILSLIPEDYCEGPLPDDDQPGHVWFFGSTVEGQAIYIKLKLTNTEAPKCLSFHLAEYPLRYPIKARKGGR